MGAPPKSHANHANNVLTAFAVASLGLAACQSPGGPGAAPASSDSPSDVGSVSFDLTIGGNYRFSSLSYDISGNGFHRAVTVDVSGSATFSTLVSGIPLGAGYTAALTAQDVSHKLTACAGSASFAVSSATTVPVAVHMICRAAAPPPPTSVPVPRSAGYALAALLLALGARRLRHPLA